MTGAQTHFTSLHNTRASSLPIGETTIGRHGAKQRWLVSGQKRATPRPPFVKASSSGWERAQAKTNAKVRASRRVTSVSSAAVTSAKAIEWVKPR